MSTKNTVKLSKAVFQDLIERGMNRPMIAKELGIKARLVNEAFDRWELKVKRVAEVVEWDDDVTVTDSTVNVVQELPVEEFGDDYLEKAVDLAENDLAQDDFLSEQEELIETEESTDF